MQPQNVSVIDPVNPTLEKVKDVLFRPFDLNKWLVIGFCAFLACLGQGGGGGGGGGSRINNIGQSPQDCVNTAKEFLLAHMVMVVTIGIAVLIIGIAIWLVTTWLGSRGKFMFLHCIAENTAEVKIPWAKFKDHGNSLFAFKIVVFLLSFLAITLEVIATVGLIIFIDSNGFLPLAIVGIVILASIFITTIIALGLIHKLTNDFVIPIMYLRTTSIKAAWREFSDLLVENKGRFALYLLFQFVIGMVIGILVFFSVLCTCGIACCLYMIPYIGTVAMLPFIMFTRSYSLCYFAQFGQNFNVFYKKPEIPEALPEEGLAPKFT